jgi:hypothetical protein
VGLDVVLLYEVVYGELEEFVSFEDRVALDQGIVEGFHSVFFDLKRKLFPIHFDVIDVKTFAGEVFLTHLLVAGFVFFEGLADGDDVGLDIALRFAQLRSGFFDR